MKEKIQHFWYYYKWHVLSAIVIGALLVSLLKSCTTREIIDLKMVYFSTRYISDEAVQGFEDSLRDQGLVKDIDGDGEAKFYLDVVLDDFEVDGNTDEATMSKIQTIVFAGDHTLMLVHQYALEDYDGCFADLSDVAGDNSVYTSPESGFVTGISVEGNTYLEELGIDTTSLYAAMRRRTDKEAQADKNRELFDAAYDVLDFILSSNEVPN